MDAFERGGLVEVYGKTGVVRLATDENGRLVSVANETDNRKAKLGINEHGDSVAVYGKGSNKSRAIITVNEYGSRAVSTWDKNGYRLATLT